jgi:nicotinamidase-related amidase
MSPILDPIKTALVLIDLQHGIVAFPAQPHASSKVVERSRSMAESFRKKGSPVVYVRVDLSDMLPIIVDVSHSDPNAVIPAIASELVPDAGFQKGDLLVTKRHWGAFGQTGLEDALRGRGVDTIVLAGLATNFGVESTARQAVGLGFQVVIAEDACSSISPDAHTFAVKTIFPLIGRVRTVAEVIDALA